MTAFEPWTAGVRSGRPTNCATTNAHLACPNFFWFSKNNVLILISAFDT